MGIGSGGDDDDCDAMTNSGWRKAAGGSVWRLREEGRTMFVSYFRDEVADVRGRAAVNGAGARGGRDEAEEVHL